MFTIRRIEIDNFVCFHKLVIEPSTDAERPLTVIRAENGCGKTTLLRAIRWGMYGEPSVPGNSAHFSLHPADWHPHDDPVDTTVRIEFETDGSSRDDPQESAGNTVYELTRSVTTLGQQPSRPGDPDFRRIDMRTQLTYRARDGSWHPHDAGIDVVVGQLLPWELRDFFVMDADEAADFVGGTENRVLSRREVTGKTTYAIRALLGLEVFKRASDKVRGLSREFGRRATRAVGSDDLNRQQEELDELRRQQEQLLLAVKQGTHEKEEVQTKLEEARDTLESAIGDIGALDQLQHRLKANRIRHQELTSRGKVAIEQYAGELQAIDLLSALSNRELEEAKGALQPLYDNDMIPVKHLGFVRNLLRNGVCVCGQNLSDGASHRTHVEEMLQQSTAQEERADYLAQVFDAAGGLQEIAQTDWEQRCNVRAEAITIVDDELSAIEDDRRDINAKLKEIQDVQVQTGRDKIDTLETHSRRINRELMTNELALEQKNDAVSDLDRRIDQQRKRQRAAYDQEACKDTADAVVRVLNLAYSTIESEQVKELSEEMDILFSRMAANVVDDGSQGLDRKATLKMIAQVGVRPLDTNAEEFELYALNHRGRSMPPTEINGASRRTLALSFVVALCNVSNTHASLVADSLLNFMSGVVRTNTLEVAATCSTQPILLLTGSDLEAQTEVDTVHRFAGSTYTLTGQWQHGTQRGDVVNQNDARRVALLCGCGPRQYCRVCERVGQASMPSWTQRTQ